MPFIPGRQEEKRLRELYRYDILDSEPEPAFDRIVRLTQKLFEVPFVLITLVDSDRQWFKAAYGVEDRETDLTASFCVYAIQDESVMVVPDTTRDERFVDMPVVTGAPFYRFYAGAPLRTPGGCHLGTLCVLDRVPHAEFSREAQALLADLAAAVISELELRLAATEDARQQLVRMSAILENITELVHHQQGELLRINRLKDEFFAKMSHELRTPLTAIIGFSELLGEGDLAPLDRQQREYLGVIAAAGQHLLTLTNDLLDLSKIEAEMMELRLEPTDVRELVTGAVAIVRSQLRKKRLRLKTALPRRVMPLHADARKVKQVLVNLLANAVKFTPPGGLLVVGVEDDAHEVRFEVRDSGPGISADDQARLFQPFVQLDHATQGEFQGTGLGLALVKQLVELHGGRVWLDSRAGEGSTFGFSVPRLEVDPEAR